MNTNLTKQRKALEVISRLNTFRWKTEKQHFGFGLPLRVISRNRLPNTGGWIPHRRRQLLATLKGPGTGLRRQNKQRLLRLPLNRLVYGGALLLAFWLFQNQPEALLEVLRRTPLEPLKLPELLEKLLAEFIRQLAALRNLPRPIAEGLPEGLGEQTGLKASGNCFSQRWWDWPPLPKGDPGLAGFPKAIIPSLGTEGVLDGDLDGLKGTLWGFFSNWGRKPKVVKALEEAKTLTPRQWEAFESLLEVWGRLWADPNSFDKDPEKLLLRRNCRKALYTWQKLADPVRFSEISWHQLHQMLMADSCWERCHNTKDQLGLFEDDVVELLWPYAAKYAKDAWRGHLGPLSDQMVEEAHQQLTRTLWGPEGAAENCLYHRINASYSDDWREVNFQTVKNYAHLPFVGHQRHYGRTREEIEADAQRQQLEQQRLEQQRLEQQRLEQQRLEQIAKAVREQLGKCRQTLRNLQQEIRLRLAEVRARQTETAPGSSERWALLYEQQQLLRLKSKNQLRLKQFHGTRRGRANPPSNEQLESWRSEFSLRMLGYVDREGQQLEKRLRRREEAQQDQLQQLQELRKSQVRKQARAERRSHQNFVESNLDQALENLEKLFQGIFVVPFQLMNSFFRRRDAENRTLAQWGWDWLEGYDPVSKKTRLDRAWDWFRVPRTNANGTETSWWDRLWGWLRKLPGQFVAWFWSFLNLVGIILLVLLWLLLLLMWLWLLLWLVLWLVRFWLDLWLLVWGGNRGYHQPPPPPGNGGGMAVESEATLRQSAAELLREPNANRALAEGQRAQIQEQVWRHLLEWALERTKGESVVSESPKPVRLLVEKLTAEESAEIRLVSRSPSPVAKGIPKEELDWVVIRPEGESFPLEEWLGNSEKGPNRCAPQELLGAPERGVPENWTGE